VLLRALESRGALNSQNGRIAVGWLIVEDLAMVIALVLLPLLAQTLVGTGVAQAQGQDSLAWTLFSTLARVAAFVALMLLVGRRVFPWLLWQVARTGSRELFTLCVVSAAMGIALAAAKIFGVSFALGAFLAGMVLRESALSHRAADESLPLRDAFAVLFFVSVGILFDPQVLLERPLQVLAVLAIVVIGKSLAAAAVVLAMRYPLNTALTVSASLAQIGEFSFILAGLGVALNLLPVEGQSLILAGALMSIALNPLVFAAVEPAQRWILRRSGAARALEQAHDPLAALPQSTEQKYLAGQVVIVGYGRVGRKIAERLRERGVAAVIAEQNREVVESLRAQGWQAVAGDAAEPVVLIQAHIARARALIIATSDTVGVRQMVQTARTLNPKIDTLIRVHSEDEAARMREENLGAVFLGEHALADAMAAHLAERKPEV
jgi:CPA2 family monovalent cation:H+ antiporter-2